MPKRFRVKAETPRLEQIAVLKGSSCKEKERLLVAHKAFEIYIQGVSELAEGAGVIAHTEF